MPKKYKISDIAKHCELSTEDIFNILLDCNINLKKNRQMLSIDELNILLEKFTQNNQVNNLLEILNDSSNKKHIHKNTIEERTSNLIKNNDIKLDKITTENEILELNKIDVNSEPTVKKIHRINTRIVNVNLEKYDEKIENLVPNIINEKNTESNKEKIVKKYDNKKSISSKKRQEEQLKTKKIQKKQEIICKKNIVILNDITITDLSSYINKSREYVINELSNYTNYIKSNDEKNEIIDFNIAFDIASKNNIKLKNKNIINKNTLNNKIDNENMLISRNPIVTIMGHVDHGKTSLLDQIRKSKLTNNEFGGITQHIGAYTISINGKSITFLDTPGHAAFTSMRSRGTKITDIVILVVSIDDGIMPQTIEAINHAKEAKVPIIVAINKIDMPHNENNFNNIIQQLASYDLVAEEWGGDIIICKISAKTNIGIDHLLDMILLLAEILELKANPNKLASGSVIEASLNKHKGPLATLLIQNGSLRTGDFIVTSNCYGKIKFMLDDNRNKINIAGPSNPVEILGLNDVPNAGDSFYAVNDEKKAKFLIKNNIIKQKQDKNKLINKVTLENIFEHINDNKTIELKIIIKGDTQGSVEAICNTLKQLIYDNVKIKIIHSAVGNINESDITLAQTSDAILIGFNIQQNKNNLIIDKFKNVDIRNYNIIYDCIEDIKTTMQGLLLPILKEVISGHAEVKQIFKLNNNIIAGCYVTDGKIHKNHSVRIIRDKITILDNENILLIKRFKDDVKEVMHGYECGISLKKYDELKVNDIIECYEIK